MAGVEQIEWDVADSQGTPGNSPAQCGLVMGDWVSGVTVAIEQNYSRV